MLICFKYNIEKEEIKKNDERKYIEMKDKQVPSGTYDRNERQTKWSWGDSLDIGIFENHEFRRMSKHAYRLVILSCLGILCSCQTNAGI